ncbi:MAG: hypothetical protein AABZ32_06835 [Bacteroidota bacterium]
MKNMYLTQAQKLYALSKKELNGAKHSNDNELARDGAGKAWIATTDALRGFLLSQGISEKKLPKSERHRHDLLAQYGNEKMRLLYMSIRGQLHENVYYEGMINYLWIFEALGDVKKFIHRCGNGG